MDLPIRDTGKRMPKRHNPFNTREIQMESTSGTKSVTLVTPEEIERWSQELEKQTPQTKPLDLYKLRVEIEELMAGNVGLDRLNTYSEEELLFICKSLTRNARVLHEKLTDTAASMGIDISKSKPLQKPYRADFSDKDLENLNVSGKKAQVKELLTVLQKWGDVERWKARWAKKKDEARSKQVTPEFVLKEADKPEQLYPMREVPGGKYVHVPWSRQVIVSFTNDFPKLREKPVDWYRQVERFVKVQKCLWKDLDGFFDIVVPVDLWTECKIAIAWPSEEYPRDSKTGEPSKEVMKKYDQVIQHLKQKVPAKETDWTKIDRTTQERDETVHSFYERLLQVFKTYSGIDNIEMKDMTHFIYRFVNGLRPEICQWIKDNKICWQSKKMDEVLRYAKYCEDEMADKRKALKEKVMWAQVKLAEQQEKQLNKMNKNTQNQGSGGGGKPKVKMSREEAKKKFPCHQCGEIGHWRDECPYLQNDNTQTPDLTPQTQNEKSRKTQHQVKASQLPRAPKPNYKGKSPQGDDIEIWGGGENRNAATSQFLLNDTFLCDDQY
ncbi:uncharacterized protein LOC144782663 [Lissotriton helveticus]